MKKLILILGLIFLLTASVSAKVYVNYNIYDGFVTDRDEVTYGDTKLNSFGMIAYRCSNQDCSQVSEREWGISLVNYSSGKTNKATLEYPTELKSEYGYAVYFFRPEYLPYEFHATWAGNGEVSKTYNIYLRKIERASAPILNFNIQGEKKQDTELKISADILSPLVEASNRDVNYNPEELVKDQYDYYSSNVEAKLEIKQGNNLVYTQEQEFNMFMSTEKNIEFSWTPEKSGNYKVILTTNIDDPKVLNQEQKIYTKDITISPSEQPITDTEAPVITIISPENSKTYTNNIYSMIFKVNDKSSITCKYSKDNGQQIPVSCIKLGENIININSKEGTNIWTIYAEDSYGNKAQKSVSFFVNTTQPINYTDTEAPVITIISPENGKTYNSQIKYLHYKIQDENLKSCQYSVDGTKKYLPCNRETITLNSKEGTNIWTIYAEDSYGNKAQKTINFNVVLTPQDTTPPIITIISPEEKEYTDSTIQFKVITNEESTLSLNIDSTGERTMNNPYDHIFTYTKSLSDGNHRVLFTATDKAGNKAQKLVLFSIDTEDENDKDEETNKTNKELRYLKDFDYVDLQELEYLEQYQKPKIIYLEEPDEEQKLSLWQKFINWIKDIFY